MRSTTEHAIGGNSIIIEPADEHRLPVPADRAMDEYAAARDGDLPLAGIVELLLKDQRHFDWRARDTSLQRGLIPRLLAIGLTGYVVFGVALAVMFGAARIWPELLAISAWLDKPTLPLVTFASLDETAWWQPWVDGSAINLVAAFSFGLIGSIGVCLPSFYFYGLLAGVRTSLLHVTAIALKGMASGAIALIGILPLYFAIALGFLVCDAPRGMIELLAYIGFALPFIAGLWGTQSLYVALVNLVDTMPNDRRYERTCFLRRLLVSWSVCFTAVTPVMIFTVWEFLERN